METLTFFQQRPSSDGSGSGYGSGYSYGSGDGSGYSSGDGYGDGDGSGVKTLNGRNLEYIDGVPTIITSIKGDLAKGFIVELSDFSKSPCFVARNGYTYAHGSTAREATKALQDKLIAEMSVEERIQEFTDLKLSPSKKYPVKLFYDWHGRLTGSCESGRDAFAKSHGIDIEHGTMTLGEFLNLVKNAYGADVINQISAEPK